MKLTNYQSDSGNKLGIVTERGLLDVAAAAAACASDPPTSADALYAAGNAALPALRALLDAANDPALYLDEADVTYAPAVPNPGKILCVGLNYKKHAAETGMAEPDYPVLFSKFNNAIAAPKEDIPLQPIGRLSTMNRSWAWLWARRRAMFRSTPRSSMSLLLQYE